MACDVDLKLFFLKPPIRETEDLVGRGQGNVKVTIKVVEVKKVWLLKVEVLER